jgi:hypothetical protein
MILGQAAKRINRDVVYKGKIFTVAQDTIRFPDGKEAKWDVLLHSGATAIVPIDNNGNIVLVEQYRCIEDGNILEIPAGKLEKGEEPYLCAARELEEETVVFPAPFGPISPTNSPYSKSKLTLETAVNPPKDLVNFFTLKILIV